MPALRVALTFDIDMVDGRWSAGRDECGYFFEAVAPEVGAAGVPAATVFVRLDDEIARVYGRADYVLAKYGSEFARLKQLGWEIGWHPHPYSHLNGLAARQNTDENEIAAELLRHGPSARAAGMTSVRMGWGFMTSRLMKILEDLGFQADSSAIPRPRYLWERSVKDWSTTPAHAYYPSVHDYRVPGNPHCTIIELPMSVAPLRVSYDSEPVLRCINPAHRPMLFEQAIRGLNSAALVATAHPHEFAETAVPAELFSGEPRVLRQNLAFVTSFASPPALRWTTISELAEFCARELQKV